MPRVVMAGEDRQIQVLDAVAQERLRQDNKWGVQDHVDFAYDPSGQDDDIITRLAISRRAIDQCDSAFRRGIGSWSHILVEEVSEAVEKAELASRDHLTHDAELRKELVQVAAVAVAWIEAIDRRQSQPKGAADAS